MTTFARKTYVCAVCKNETNFATIISTNTFGSADLDLRPPEMKRSTIPYWIQQCPVCGYTNRTIEVAPPTNVNMQWLQSDSYTNCEGIQFQDNDAKKFYHHYMVCKSAKETESAFRAILCAAWMCDDANEKENAIACRLVAAELAMEILVTDSDPKWLMIRTDLLRRAGHFDMAIEETKQVILPKTNKLIGALLAFELKHAELHDAECYRVDYALNEMGYEE